VVSGLSKTLVFSSSSSQSISTSLEFASGLADGTGGAAPGEPMPGLAPASNPAGGGGGFDMPGLLRSGGGAGMLPGKGGGPDERLGGTAPPGNVPPAGGFTGGNPGGFGIPSKVL